MSDSKPRITLTGLGILSKLIIMHYFKEGHGIEVSSIPREKRPLDSIKGIEIAPNLKLRLVNKEDVEHLSHYPTSVDSIIQYSLKDYVLECSLDSEDNSKAQAETLDTMKHKMNSTITALRLLKHGYIDANVTLIVTTRGTEKHASLMAEKPGHAFSWDHYQLRTDELPKLTELIKRVSDIDFTKRSSFRIALDRFNKSYYDSENEDKLIDYIIAFEALFIESQSRSQRAVIPLACAMLLGNSPDERKEIRELLDFAYEIRNCIVHGSHYDEKLSAENLELEDLVKNVENLLRTSVKKLM